MCVMSLRPRHRESETHSLGLPVAGVWVVIGIKPRKTIEDPFLLPSPNSSRRDGGAGWHSGSLGHP